MPFIIIRDDITRVTADAIVNTANEELQEGSGTSRAIYLAAGEEQLKKACEAIGHCDLGKAVITDAYQLPARYIIHAVGPVWSDGNQQEEQYLYSAYMEAMKLAFMHQLESIAFPLISSGYYGYPKEKAFRVATSAIRDFLRDHEMFVYLIIYDKKSLAVSHTLYDSIEEYIDDHYVSTHNEEYRRIVQVKQSEPKKTKRNKHKEVIFNEWVNLEEECECLAPIGARSLDDLMNYREETFSQMLLRLIDEKGMTDTTVYKKANIDRRHFSKIRSDPDYTPTKKTVLAFVIALELNLDEAKDLMGRAGYAFSKSSKSDIILCYFIEHNIYDIFQINEMLFAYDQPVLGANVSLQATK